MAGVPTIQSSHFDQLLQINDFIVHALHKQGEEPSPRMKELSLHLAFGILDDALNRRVSRRDPQGVSWLFQREPLQRGNRRETGGVS